MMLLFSLGIWETEYWVLRSCIALPLEIAKSPLGVMSEQRGDLNSRLRDFELVYTQLTSSGASAVRIGISSTPSYHPYNRYRSRAHDLPNASSSIEGKSRQNRSRIARVSRLARVSATRHVGLLELSSVDSQVSRHDFTSWITLINRI